MRPYRAALAAGRLDASPMPRRADQERPFLLYAVTLSDRLGRLRAVPDGRQRADSSPVAVSSYQPASAGDQWAGPCHVLRSGSPALIGEIWGYLLTH
jgi:hypothetical protein